MTPFNWYGSPTTNCGRYGSPQATWVPTVRGEVRTIDRTTLSQGRSDAAWRSERPHSHQGRQENGTWVPESEIGQVLDATRDNDPKNKRVSVVPLSRLAREVIGMVPIIDAHRGKDFVFTTTGQGPLQGWSKYKERLDGKMLALLQQWAVARGDDPNQVELKPWQHRNLRRTARTLMSRMGVGFKGRWRRRQTQGCLAHKSERAAGTSSPFSPKLSTRRPRLKNWRAERVRFAIQ